MSNEKIELDISENQRETLINCFVQDHLCGASVEIFIEYCHEHGHEEKKYYEGALVAAIINEMVNNILREEIERSKASPITTDKE